MDITKYIICIQKAIAESDQYEDYVPLLEEYKEYLKVRLSQNAKDIDAACQLAPVYNELRYAHSDSIRLLEKALQFCSDDINLVDKSRILTNLAYYYEDNCNKENCIRCLRAAIDLKPQMPNAYDALARYCLEDVNFADAINYCQIASSLSNDIKYKYNFAVVLYQSGKITKAKTIFEELTDICKDERRTLYGLAACFFYLVSWRYQKCTKNYRSIGC